MLKAVIFDMDGVIIDSEPIHARAAVLVLKRYNIEISPDYCSDFIGSTTRYMCETMINEFQINATPEELINANQEMKKYMKESEGYPPVPHVTDLIKDLHAHGLRLVIASSSSPEEIAAVMDALKIKDNFEGYVSGMSVSNPKPSPDIFLAAVDKLQINPTECIIIEDSMNGVNAAFAAGIICIGFANPISGKQDLSKAAMIVEGINEIDYKFIISLYASMQ